MQISAENLQEELDLRHVENRQIKKELEKLIQDYKPEKTASTDVTMRIILKDEEPVCQPLKLVKDKFPLPIIEDVLDTLQEAKVYSTLDLRNGFFHVDVDEDCRKYTSFIVPDGQFEFNKVPFGLSTSPGVFQRYVSSIFRDLTRKGIVISYLDDLVIPAKTNRKKAELLKPSPTKTLAVRKFPEPTTIKQVQNFLGLTGYFRKYIKDYSKIAKPLSDLTRKENLFVSDSNKKEAVEKLKKIMSEGPILHLYKYGRKTELHTDACKQGYGAILLQEAEDGKLHPVTTCRKRQIQQKKMSAENALEKLKQQQKTFGNPIRIISDRGSAFTSKLFNDYCDEENIQHLQIATGVPRGNGQVERIHRTLIPVLTKLSLDDSTKWYKYVDRLQRILNSTISRSTKWTPFELLVGIKMRNKEDILIKDLLLEEMAKQLLEQREFLRNDAKKNIETLQSENRKTYNRRRKKASLYKEGDLVAIQRTQFGAGLKLRPKY
ncbi:retrovirus-related Pol polyprotein from transposon 17.6 [Trichonephila clavipes]|nr:retrovirus-related Pol polyprotein from transposon 17.6 [Trichonephila clavipes]